VSRQHRQLIYDSQIYWGLRNATARQVLARMAEMTADEEPSKPRNPNFETYIGWTWLGQATLAKELGSSWTRTAERIIARIRNDGWFAEERTYRDAKGYKHTEYRLDFEKIKAAIPTDTNGVSLPTPTGIPTDTNRHPYRHQQQGLPTRVSDDCIYSVEKEKNSVLQQRIVAAAVSVDDFEFPEEEERRKSLPPRGGAVPHPLKREFIRPKSSAPTFASDLVAGYTRAELEARRDKHLKVGEGYFYDEITADPECIYRLAFIEKTKFMTSPIPRRKSAPGSDRNQSEYHDLSKYSALKCCDCQADLSTDWSLPRCQVCIDKFNAELAAMSEAANTTFVIDDEN